MTEGKFKVGDKVQYAGRTFRFGLSGDKVYEVAACCGRKAVELVGVEGTWDTDWLSLAPTKPVTKDEEGETMTECKFKVGDKVRCKESTTVRTVAVVRQGLSCWFLRLYGQEAMWPDSDYELVESVQAGDVITYDPKDGPPALRKEQDEAALRKAQPIVTGCIDYFSAALLEISKVSLAGNEQHHPGMPLHWEADKSTDHANASMRHMIDRGTLDTDGQRHSAKAAWRAVANLQAELERESPELKAKMDLYRKLAAEGKR